MTIYLDNNATTQIAPEVFKAMEPYLTKFYGNASSMHHFGGQVGKALQQAREELASLLECTTDEIIFTSCGTESNSTAIFSAINSFPEKRHIVTTRVEHPAVLSLCTWLQKQKGYDVTFLDVDTLGNLDLEEVKKSIRTDTAIVSVMWANNETGVIFPVEEIAKLAKEKGALFHTDAVQAIGKIPCSLKNSNIDMLSLSGHKLHAPKGIGALYVKKRTPYRPFLIGGHQEKSRRAGTENSASIIALGVAAKLATDNMHEENTYVKKLRDKLEREILANIPETRLNGDPDNRLPNTSNISFGYIEGEAILLHLDVFEICASSGSACTSGSLEPSHVLRALGVPYTFAHGSIRFSLSRYTTEKEIDTVLEHLPKIIENLRKLSPFNANQNL